jgi:hypothetical protein
MPFRTRRMNAKFACGAGLLGAMALLAGCKTTGELVVQDGVGITAVRSTCPAVGIADYTGDITTFRFGSGQTANAIDLTGAITDVRSQCDPKSNPVQANLTFKVLASRADGRGDRVVNLPYFITVMRGGNVVIAKRLGTATVHFADGQTRGEVVASGGATINKADATLDRAVRDRLLKQRKAGEADAAIDPLTDPEVRAAVAKATFEVLVGFQLTPEQLQYNGTR